jgi:hypothetical protein
MLILHLWRVCVCVCVAQPAGPDVNLRCLSTLTLLTVSIVYFRMC